MLQIAEKKIKSRLFLGTGKFASSQIMRQTLHASETEVVTVALRRVDMKNADQNILNFIDREKCQLLPNTSGAKNAKEAIFLAKLSKEMGLSCWVKLEVIPDPYYLLPDSLETLKAAEVLVKEGFVVLPYIQADPLLAKQLEEVGCSAVMPLGSWIGSGRGLKTKEALQIIVEQARVPVVIDAGLGAPSHAAEAMEMGADAVLVNTAIATAKDPIQMALGFKKGVEAGRIAFLAGSISPKSQAEASSPLEGIPQWTL